MEDINLLNKAITIEPSIEEYPYGEAYCLSLIVDNKVYYKFSGVDTNGVVETCLYHLGILLKEEVFDE